MLRIDPEFRALIPPLSDEERRQLESNLLADGCRDPLVVWNELILDGHNRYELCQAHALKYATVEHACADRDDAKIWIIRNQFGRRNLSTFTRGELALKLEPLIAAKAKARQIRKPESVTQKSAEQTPIETRKELAKVAGVSHDTIAKVKVIAAKAAEPVKEQLRRGETTVNKEYNAIVEAERKTWRDPLHASSRRIEDVSDREAESAMAMRQIKRLCRTLTRDDRQALKEWINESF